MYKNHKPVCTICKRVLLAGDEDRASVYFELQNDGKRKKYYICADCDHDYALYVQDDLIDELAWSEAQ